MEKQKKNIADIILTIVLTVLFSLMIWDYGIQEFIQEVKAQDTFCQEQGYNYSTDYNYRSCWGASYSQIECDSSRIFYTNDISWCIKRDKWGNCKEESPKYYPYQSNWSCD